MASPVPSLITSGSQTTDGPTATTASFTPEVGVLYILFATVVRGSTDIDSNVPALSASSADLTFATIAGAEVNTNTNRRKLKAWSFTSSSIDPTTITFTTPLSDYSYVSWAVEKVTGAPTTSFLGQTAVTTFASPGTSTTITYAAFDANSLALSYAGSVATGTSSSDPTSLGTTNSAEGRNVYPYETPAVDTTHVVTWGASNHCHGIGLEIIEEVLAQNYDIVTIWEAQSELLTPVEPAPEILFYTDDLEWVKIV